MTAEVQFFYTNGLEASLSPYDISLKFTRNVPTGVPTGTAKPGLGQPVESRIETLETLVVAMSPSHAKAMLPALVQMVNKYESLFGRIPGELSHQNAWDSAFGALGTQK